MRFRCGSTSADRSWRGRRRFSSARGERLRDLHEDIEHGLLRRRGPGTRERGREDPADRRCGAQGSDHDVVADGDQGEVRDERDTESAGDEALHGQMVVGVERDLRLEPRLLARVGEDARVGASVGGAEDPVVVRELGEADLVAVRPADGRLAA